MSHRLALWYINIQTILDLVGGSSPLIKAYLAAHAQEIEAHHLLYDIHPRFYQKALPITEMVHIPGQNMTPLQRKELRAVKRQLQRANQSAKVCELLLRAKGISIC